MQSRLRDAAPAGLTLIETMRWEPGAGVALLPRHLARLSAGAEAFGIPCAPAAVSERIAAVAGDAPRRLRLTLDLTGTLDLTTADLPPAKSEWTVNFAAEVLESTSIWRRFKTSERGLYERARAALPVGVDEAIFVNERGEIAEGTITNVFLEREGILLTPPLASGCLPGVLRAELLASGRAREAVLRPGDLAGGGLFLGNALRGLIPAK